MDTKRLQAVLSTLKQSPVDHSFVTVDTRIDMTPKCTKTARGKEDTRTIEFMFGHTGIFKVSRRYGQAGLSYFTNVNNKLTKKNLPPMVQGERVWGKRIADTMLIEHKDNVYLELFASASANESKHTYEWEDGTQLTDGELHVMQVLFLPIVKPSRKQTDAGLDKEEHTIYLNIKLSNVVRFKGYGVEMGGEA